jgi:type VII secretion integral membrane protein EccD
LTRSDLCRVTVVTPSKRMDVALPSSVPLAELVPTLLQSLDDGRSDAIPPSGGWSLQRFGQSPFDLSVSAAALSVKDGEMLYLRPQQAELPELAFDDVSDAVATAAAKGRRWTRRDTRGLGMGTALAAFFATAVVLLGSGPSWVVPAVISGLVTVALVVAAGAMSRALSDASTGAVLGYVAVGFALVTGLMAFAGDGPAGVYGAPSLLGGMALALVVAVGSALLIADRVPEFVGIAVVAVFALISGGIAELFHLTASGGAIVAVLLGLVLIQMIPPLAIRLAEIPLPMIPFTADDVRNDDSIVAGAAVLRQTTVAGRYVTALLLSVATITAGGALLVSGDHSPGANWTLGILGLVFVFRARVFDGRWQRLSLVISGVVVLFLLVVRGLSGVSVDSRPFLVAVPLLVAAVLLAVAGLWWHGSRVTPVWRRAADILDGLVVASLIPVALWALGLYGEVRGMFG